MMKSQEQEEEKKKEENRDELEEVCVSICAFFQALLSGCVCYGSDVNDYSD